jgi:CheY-like chemotaxis protein
MALLLERAGAIVEVADSAATARAKIESARPEAIVCDIAMPGEDGYSLIRSLRASGGPRIPAIAVTAHASAADARRALDSGFDLHLAKPVDLEVLVAKLDELISHARIA